MVSSLHLIVNVCPITIRVELMSLVYCGLPAPISFELRNECTYALRKWLITWLILLFHIE